MLFVLTGSTLSPQGDAQSCCTIQYCQYPIGTYTHCIHEGTTELLPPLSSWSQLLAKAGFNFYSAFQGDEHRV